jgi:hypothetical protein
LSRLESAVAPVSSWVEKVDPYWHRWSSAAADRVEALREWSLEMKRRCEQETARIADAVQQRVRRAAGRP